MGITKVFRRQRIKSRVRKIVSGSAEIPRLSVFRSNKQIYAQLIDDVSGKTIASVASSEKDLASKKQIAKIDQAKIVGKAIALKAVDKGIKTVVFDRNGYLYHGRVKSLAEAAREAGLEF